MMKPKLYFAHPINTYNTKLERFLLAKIAERFPEYEIVNPNAPEHYAGYKARGMDYFTQDVLRGCKVCVFLAFRDGKIGRGVFTEVMTIVWCHLRALEIEPDGVIKDWTPDYSRRLTVEETRARIRNPDDSPKPY